MAVVLFSLSIGASFARAQSGSAANASAPGTPTWQPIGPGAVQTPDFGLVSGRVTALALDPSDATGNKLYVGTTGGGVWTAQNAATSKASSVVFTPLTDFVGALNTAIDASISIGALTVQPGGSGVILAGTGDPNGMADSYYGAGVLRSTDGGNSWSLISQTRDVLSGLGTHDERFYGEAFSGFAWSTVTPQLVVAAVSQAYEGALVNAATDGVSCQGLYYSNDAGATWHMATISDGGSSTVQGPNFTTARPDGNAATSVVWNPIRKIFIAAVRFHGYYQSPDGITFTRMSVQPGTGLTKTLCPTRPASIGSIACPIYRGTLAVNPSTGDTFAWTVDINDQDQGLWQDQCTLSGSSCTNPSLTFAKQWSTSSLDSNTSLGAVTLALGGYTLALASIPAGPGAGQDTILFAGASDLWKCSLAEGCIWRNTTNTGTCKAAHVGPYQHALTWNTVVPSQVFIGNDSGLWRSTDSVGQSGQVCAASDADHFQNLNAHLGSLNEAAGFASNPADSSQMMIGQGVNGTTGVKHSPFPDNWPQIETGLGGPVAIDPSNPDKWYVNTQSGVAIYGCSTSADCTASSFGSTPLISNSKVGGDGLTMPVPAQFIVDALDPTQLLMGTCRVWRGSADGVGWSSKNAVSPILDNTSSTGACAGDALIRSMAAQALPDGTERVYLGMYGATSYGAKIAGHVLSATIDPASSTKPTWRDLSLNPVTNDSTPINNVDLDVSSVTIDPHDTTGNTVYVTIAGIKNFKVPISTVYRSTDGGAHWANITANQPETPANGIVVDPQDARTVYVATDVGVSFTHDVASCALTPSSCWSVFGTGLPLSPVVAIRTSEAADSSPVLLAATYGRGVWQASIADSTSSLTSVSASPTAVTFADQAVGTTSAAQIITLTNTGNVSLSVTSIQVSGDFTKSDDCTGVDVAPAASCSIQVKFAPNRTGSLTGQVVVSANIAGGQLNVSLAGNGLPPDRVILAPSSLDFGSTAVGSRSPVLPAQAVNNGTTAVSITSLSISGPFVIVTNSCGTSTLPAQYSCQIQLAFAPTQAGSATGTLTMVDEAGTQTMALSGIGQAVATDSLSATSLSFPGTAAGTLSDAQSITLTNSGDIALNSISISVTGPFQSSHTCNAQLAPNSACSIRVIFAPAQSGNLTGSLTVVDSIRTQTISLSGSGLEKAALSVVPPSITFAGQQVGVASAPETITVSNVGGASMANVGFQFTGSAAANYAISATNCGATLAAGASCTAQIVFTPPATGNIGATLVISSSTVGVQPFSVSLNGGGQVGGGVSVRPSQINFSIVPVGQASTGQIVTITNGSGFTIRSLSLSSNAPFVLSQNNCTDALAAGATCTVTVKFQPTISGAVTGSLTVSSPDLSTPATAALSGTGFDFSASIAGNSSQSVASGQVANYSLTINPAAGSSGTFAFACSGLPANSTCTFNPTSLTLSSGITGTVNVAIATGKSATASLTPLSAGRAITMLCGILLMPWVLKRNRKALLHLVGLVVLIAAISSCGGAIGGSSGSGGGSGNGSSTPPGTYHVAVTITSTGLSRQVTLNLTVD